MRKTKQIILYGSMFLVMTASVFCSGSREKKRDNPQWSVSVHVSGDLSGPYYVSAIRKKSEELLGKSGLAKTKHEAPGRVSIRIMSGIRDNEGVCLIRVTLEGSKPVPLAASIAAKGAITPDRSLLDVANEGIEEAVQTMSFQHKLVHAGPDAAIRALKHPEPDIQIFSARLLAETGQKKAVPDIIRLLKDPRREVVDAAAGALALLGDERAVGALIEAVDPVEPGTIMRTIDAIGQIGGEQAKTYLEMLAGGHEIKEIRKAAVSARRRIEFREKGE